MPISGQSRMGLGYNPTTANPISFPPFVYWCWKKDTSVSDDNAIQVRRHPILASATKPGCKVQLNAVLQRLIAPSSSETTLQMLAK